mmetsp:Transcript_7883/g.16918  ORF Transcript_7883/g.16918 Transcript_7883/m.16918 type:complete len:80 (-) Transcript_7883:1034-1273(-)
MINTFQCITVTMTAAYVSPRSSFSLSSWCMHDELIDLVSIFHRDNPSSCISTKHVNKRFNVFPEIPILAIQTVSTIAFR